MRREVAAVALAFLLAAPLRAEVDVTVSGSRIHVRALRASLADVLDGLARRTRMKVVYDGARPQAQVTVELRNRTPAEAVLGVLDGLAINYALVMDATGTEVETLMIVGAGGGAPAAAARAPARPPRQPVPDEQPDIPPEPEEYEERRPVPEEKEAAPEGPKATPPPFGPLNPAGAVSPFAPGLPPLPLRPTPSPTPAPNATPSPNSSS